MAQQLTQRVRSSAGIAHQEAPSAAEFGIDVGIGADAVVEQRFDQAVDAALGLLWIERTLAPVGLETGMVNDEGHVRITASHRTDVVAARKMRGHAGKRQALVDADGADTKRARLLYEGNADFG